MKLTEITKKQFLNKLSGDVQSRVLAIFKKMRDKYAPKYSNTKFTVKSKKSKYVENHYEYKIYIHYMPVEKMIELRPDLKDNDFYSQRNAHITNLIADLKIALKEEFPSASPFETVVTSSMIEPAERYIIKVWVFQPNR